MTDESLYLKIGYELKKTDVICRWYIEPAEGLSLEDAAAILAIAFTWFLPRGIFEAEAARTPP